MTDDFLKDFEGELRGAAERRAAGDRARRPWLTRFGVPAFAVASVAAVVVAVVLAGGGSSDPREETAATGATGPDGVSATFELFALGKGEACTDAPREKATDPPGKQAAGSYRIFRRRQHPPDAVSDDEVRRLPVRDYYFAGTRSPTGLGERFLLVPAPSVNVPCGERPNGPAGVCVVHPVGDRCFEWADVREARAVAGVEPGRVVGLVPDGIDEVVIESGGKRVTATVVENAFLASVPGLEQGDELTVTHVLRPLDGCAPSDAMRKAVPVLDRPADAGGVPPAVRKSLNIDLDSRVAARYARIAGGGDGITYWVIPHLKCEDESAERDRVCIYPLFEGQEDGGGGGTACALVEEITSGTAGWIHFPLRDGGDAVAGFAPPGATTAFATIARDEYSGELRVVDGIFAGTLRGHERTGEVGGLRISFEVETDRDTGPEVAVLNGTTDPGLAGQVMDRLEFVNYSPGEIGNYAEQDVQRSTVLFAPGQEKLAERIAIYLGEKYGIPQLPTAPLIDEPLVVEIVGDQPRAVVIAGGDLDR